MAVSPRCFVWCLIAWYLVREDTEDIASLTVIFGWLTACGPLPVAPLTGIVGIAPVWRHTRHRGSWAILRTTAATHPIRHASTGASAGGSGSCRTGTAARGGARRIDALVVDPVIRAAQSVLAPGRIFLGRQSSPLEMVQPPHRQHQPVFALLDHAV